MSVLTADQDVVRKEGGLQSHPVTSGEIIYKGAMACIDADGYLVAAADTAGYKFAGVASEKADNASGIDPAKDCRVYNTGVFLLTCTSITQAMVGQLMYVADDDVVDDQSTNWVCAGRLVKYVSTTQGWVDIGDRVRGASESLFVGAEAGPVDLSVSGQKALAIYADTERTSGDQMAGYFYYSIGGEGAEGQAIRAILNIADVTAGGSEEAIYAIVTANASGKPSGTISAVRGMIVMPTELTSGTWSALTGEMAFPANCDIASDAPISFIRLTASGDAVAAWRARGMFMQLQGMGTASSATNIFHTNGGAATTHGLRIDIDGVLYDILLSVATYS